MSTGHRMARVLGVVAGAAVALGAIAGYQLTRAGESPARAGTELRTPVLSPAAFQRASGVRVTRVVVSGGGGLLDLRYQVLDPGAAAAIHDARTPPQLVDERSGLVVADLFMGHSHSGPFKAARSYYLLFDNPGALVKPGARVTVQLGRARLPHVPVL